MKKTFTFFLSMLIAFAASAQILPNPGFETWDPFATYEDPQMWDTPNSFTSLAGIAVVSKSDDAYSGSYSAMLETKTVFGPNESPGLITLADFNVDITTGEASFIGGIPLTDRVLKMTGYFKYSGVDGDSAHVFVVSFRHPEGELRDTVAVGVGYLHDATDWTMFTVNMFQLNQNQPDSLNVIIQSSGSELHVGSVLFVDDLSVETITGIINLSAETNAVKVYPNPVSDFVKFEVENANTEMELTVFDNSGRLVERVSFNTSVIELNLGKLPSGMYSYKINTAGLLIGTGSFIKK